MEPLATWAVPLALSPSRLTTSRRRPRRAAPRARHTGNDALNTGSCHFRRRRRLKYRWPRIRGRSRAHQRGRRLTSRHHLLLAHAPADGLGGRQRRGHGAVAVPLAHNAGPGALNAGHEHALSRPEPPSTANAAWLLACGAAHPLGAGDDEDSRAPKAFVCKRAAKATPGTLPPLVLETCSSPGQWPKGQPP